MKIVHFDYLKEGELFSLEYDVLVLEEGPDSFSGVSLTALTEEEGREVLGIVGDFFERLKPYIRKGFRKFLRSRVSGDVEARSTKAILEALSAGKSLKEALSGK